MITTRKVTQSLTLPLLAVALALGLSAVSATPAMAKQCVWNKGGFVLRVDWFRYTDIEQSAYSPGRPKEYALLDQPIQTDVFATAQGRCISRGSTQYTAVLSICGLNSSSIEIVGMPDEWPEDQRISCPVWTVLRPSTSRYLDVWGTVFEPASGEGGSVN
jgi:hypothetical protein